MTEQNNTPSRFHTIFDCSGCNTDTFNKNNITLFGKDVSLLIDVSVYGPPAIGNFDNGNEKQTGFFHAQILEGLSQINGHYVAHTGEAYIDIISLKPIDVENIQHLINQYYQPSKINIGFIARYA